MNKNLTNEYKDLMEQETATIDADALWSRIEAALPEKEVSNIEVSDKKKTVRFGRILSWSGAAVAVCAMALIVVSQGFHFGGGASAPAMVETKETANNAAFEDCAPVAEAEAASDSYMEEVVPMNYLEFEIIEEGEEYFTCLALSSNDDIEEGHDFYLKKEEGFVAGDVYSGELIFLEEIDEMKYFEILK